MNKELDFLWSGKHFKTRDWYNPNDPHIIRMTYGEAKLLNKYCKKAKKGILEIGRFFGGSTYFIVASSPKNIPVLSVDIINHIKIYKNESDVPINNSLKDLKKRYTSNDYVKVVNYINEAQQDKKLSLLNIDSKQLELKEDYDVVFIDGDHSYEGVKNDVEKVLRSSTKYILLHDYLDEPCPTEFSSDAWKKQCQKYKPIKNYIDSIVSQNICKRIEITDTMIVLEHIKKEI